MDRYITTEFGKIYRRVLEVEIRLKERLEFALQATFGSKAFYRLIPYLRKIKHDKYIYRIKKQKRDKIQDIINSNKIDEEKMLNFFELAYLSDVLNILTQYKPIYSNKLFVKNFYISEVNFDLIKIYCANLVNLRNTIMHFNFNQYDRNKRKYLQALSFWERLLECSLSFVHTLPKIKPSTSEILKLIHKHYPNIYNSDDRLVADIFDDIAFINGMSINKLPKYWTIGRQWYSLKKEIEQLEQFSEQSDDKEQLPLF